MTSSGPDQGAKYFRGRIPQDELHDLYVVQQQSAAKIATRYGCSKQKVRTDLDYHQIPKRTTGSHVSGCAADSAHPDTHSPRKEAQRTDQR